MWPSALGLGPRRTCVHPSGTSTWVHPNHRHYARAPQKLGVTPSRAWKRSEIAHVHRPVHTSARSQRLPFLFGDDAADRKVHITGRTKKSAQTHPTTCGGASKEGTPPEEQHSPGQSLVDPTPPVRASCAPGPRRPVPDKNGTLEAIAAPHQLHWATLGGNWPSMGL